VIDDLHRDAAGLGLAEWAGSVTVQGSPCFGINFGFKGRLQGAVGIIRTEKVSLADEKAFLIIVGVDEPARDAVSSRSGRRKRGACSVN
jgi:hypothetical protein